MKIVCCCGEQRYVDLLKSFVNGIKKHVLVDSVKFINIRGTTVGNENYTLTAIKKDPDGFVNKHKADVVLLIGYQSRYHDRLIDCYKKSGSIVFIISDGAVQSIDKYSKDYFYSVSLTRPSCYGDHIYEIDLPYRDPLPYKNWIKEWNTGSEGHILICHQPSKECESYFEKFILRSLDTDRNVIYRTHPRTNPLKNPRIEPYTLFSESVFKHKKSTNLEWHTAQDYTLEQDLYGAYCMITCFSLSTVYSALKGIPIITTGSSMAEMVANRWHPDIFENGTIEMPDRVPWMNWLTWQQYTKYDMETGIPWTYFVESRKRFDSVPQDDYIPPKLDPLDKGV